MPCVPRSCICGKYTAPLRHVVSVLLALGLMVGYCQRVAISIAIVEMVEHKVKAKKDTACPMIGNESIPKKTHNRFQGVTRPWTEADQGVVLLSFYCGYLLSHLPAGLLIDRYGSRWFLAGGMIISSITSALVPVVVQQFEHYAYTAVLRALTGVGQAVLYPGITATLSRWIPRAERATFGSVVYAANSIGTILGTLVSGLMIHFLKSWPMVFYFWSVIGIWWTCMFLLYVYSDPAVHPHITEEEKAFIAESIPKKGKERTPVKRIFSDIAVWSLVVGQFGYNYVHFSLLSNLPKYMYGVLNFKIKDNALASSLPYLATYIASIAIGHLADYLITKKKVKIIIIRKTLTGLAMIVPATMLLLAGYSRCNAKFAIGSFVLALLFRGLHYSGLKVNLMDICSNHAGFVMSFVNACAVIPGIVAPYVIGNVAKNNTFEEWDIIFWATFGISLVCCGFYVIFGRAVRRSWDYTKEELEAKAEEDKKLEENKTAEEKK